MKHYTNEQIIYLKLTASISISISPKKVKFRNLLRENVSQQSSHAICITLAQLLITKYPWILCINHQVAEQQRIEKRSIIALTSFYYPDLTA
uniref:Uncharacterized protein n=2 Tax=Arundo donax TaxID=35708 RepID=A0A0A9GCP8_ARUDO